MQSVSRLLAAMVVLVLAVSSYSVMRGDKSAGTALDDMTLTTQVKTALAGDPTASASRVDVDVDKGRVTLTGTAKSKAEAKAAEDVARRVEGVKSVESHIRVAEADTSTPQG